MTRKTQDRKPSRSTGKKQAARDAGTLALRAGAGGPAGLISQALGVARRYPALALAATALAGYAAGRRAQRRGTYLPPRDTKVRDAWAPRNSGARGAHPPAQDHRNLLTRMQMEEHDERS
ncbi:MULTISPECIES: hypothetical protein [unclassified Mameliella]|uniref:hypothetical protein n=1 Tax=unclassified Mameliella TaxID=2630630 RepID=UPI00273FD637|nr:MULTISPECIES: hypothetical protein [unclassified Mameliella]